MKIALIVLAASSLTLACGERPDRPQIPVAEPTPEPSKGQVPAPELPTVPVTNPTSPSQANPPKAPDSPSQTSPQPQKPDVDPVQSKDPPKPQPKPDGKVEEKPIPRAKWGINFEDVLEGDNDFNDAVLCFNGAVEVKNRIVSKTTQEIDGVISSISYCKHNLRLTVYKPDNKVSWSRIYPALTGKEVRFVLGAGEGFELDMIPVEGCNPGVARPMGDDRFAKVLKNQCNLTGR